MENAVETTPAHEFYIVRTAPGKEDKFISAVESMLAKKEDHGIYAVFRPESVNGYVFVEAHSLTKVVDSLRNVPNNKGVIRKPINFEEFAKYFEKDGEQVIVHERDIIEIIAGPFKGDKAKVIRIVPGKDELVIEPLGMSVPIPITLSIDSIRVIKLDEKISEVEKDE